MALPQSFQEALSRAETERKLERDTVLQRIGETVQKGVPYLSGVVAGALSKSPIMALGATFVADRLQARFEEKREQRKTRRFEERQRKEAAKIAVREGLYQNEKEALADIEANRLAEEEENTRQQQQQLLQKFGLNRKEEEVQQQEEVVRDQTEGGGGLALETTLAHIDSEISGIADILLDKFADDEDKFDKSEDRRELEAARLREQLSEAGRQRGDAVAGEPEREQRSLLSKFFGDVPLPLLLVGATAAIIAAIAAAFDPKEIVKSVTESANKNADDIANKINPNINEVQKALTKNGEDQSILIAEFKALTELGRYTNKALQSIKDLLKNRLNPPTNRPTRVPNFRPRVPPLIAAPLEPQLQQLIDDIVTKPPGTPQREFRVVPQDRLVQPQQRFTYNQVIDDVISRVGKFVIGALKVGGVSTAVYGVAEDFINDDPNTFGPADLLRPIIDPLQQGAQKSLEGEIKRDLLEGNFPLGRNMGGLSFDLMGSAQPIIVAPTDASTVVQNTSVSANKTFSSVAVSPINIDMRKKFVA
jgi:hypothetical protein